jgi:hypothetical protein
MSLLLADVKIAENCASVDDRSDYTALSHSLTLGLASVIFRIFGDMATNLPPTGAVGTVTPRSR